METSKVSQSLKISSINKFKGDLNCSVLLGLKILWSSQKQYENIDCQFISAFSGVAKLLFKEAYKKGKARIENV